MPTLAQLQQELQRLQGIRASQRTPEQADRIRQLFGLIHDQRQANRPPPVPTHRNPDGTPTSALAMRILDAGGIGAFSPEQQTRVLAGLSSGDRALIERHLNTSLPPAPAPTQALATPPTPPAGPLPPGFTQPPVMPAVTPPQPAVSPPPVVEPQRIVSEPGPHTGSSAGGFVPSQNEAPPATQLDASGFQIGQSVNASPLINFTIGPNGKPVTNVQVGTDAVGTEFENVKDLLDTVANSGGEGPAQFAQFLGQIPNLTQMYTPEELNLFFDNNQSLVQFDPRNTVNPSFPEGPGGGGSGGAGGAGGGPGGAGGGTGEFNPFPHATFPPNADFAHLVNTLIAQGMSRQNATNALTQRAMELADQFGAQFQGRLDRQDQLVDRLSGTILPGLEGIIGRADQGLDPATRAAMNANVTDRLSSEREGANEAIRLALARRGAIGGQTPGSRGDIVRGFSPVESQFRLGRAQAERDVLLADQGQRNLNRQLALSGIGAGTGFLGTAGALQNPFQFTNAQQGFEGLAQGAFGLGNQAFGSTVGALDPAADTEPTSFKNLLLAALAGSAVGTPDSPGFGTQALQWLLRQIPGINLGGDNSGGGNNSGGNVDLGGLGPGGTAPIVPEGAIAPGDPNQTPSPVQLMEGERSVAAMPRPTGQPVGSAIPTGGGVSIPTGGFNPSGGALPQGQPVPAGGSVSIPTGGFNPNGGALPDRRLLMHMLSSLNRNNVSMPTGGFNPNGPALPPPVPRQRRRSPLGF